MTIKDRIAALRELMERESLDAYIVSGTDPHNSEYLPDTWKQREWISGFTGSFGTVVVLKDKAGLWTDSRYFIQAENQLQGSGIALYKLRVPGCIDYPEWLAQELAPESRVGVDGFCISVADMKHLQEVLQAKNVAVVDKNDLLGDIWLDRPALPDRPVFLLSEKVAGATVVEKLGMVRESLAQATADYFLFSCLDEIAWLYNMRCDDIAYNPVAISYAIVGREGAWLFVKRSKVSAEVREQLRASGIEVLDYHHLFLFLDEMEKGARFCADVSTLNFSVYHKIATRFTVAETTSPIVLAKSIKNATEIAGFKKACQADGVAMAKFFYWLEHHWGEHLTETQVSDVLTSLRAEQPGYVSDSFGNISAYGANAALPHYSAVPGKDSELQPRGLYLVDSGGQYEYGTTDITRTVPLGALSRLEKEDYTIVLKGMIALACATFPRGTRGCNLDAIARQPIWKHCRNYGHGTGHGVGFFLNVHEGPQSIRQELKEQALLPGMVTSDEPGLYREGSHGIRHENLILCVPVTSNEFGEWYGFETLTLCYFDTSALLLELLNQEEIEWLNAYHRMVYEKIAPCLTPDEARWLAEKTKAVG